MALKLYEGPRKDGQTHARATGTQKYADIMNLLLSSEERKVK
jgi:hypothetical protein